MTIAVVIIVVVVVVVMQPSKFGDEARSKSANQIRRKKSRADPFRSL